MDFGGIIRFKLPDGSNLAVRGSVTHQPVRTTSEAIANHDGSLDRSITPTGYKFAMSIANKDSSGNPVNLEALMALSGVTFTVMHDGEKVDRTYSKAFLTGTPSVDDMTGEVSGIEGAAEGMLEVKR